jgi:hypothetical protein
MKGPAMTDYQKLRTFIENLGGEIVNVIGTFESDEPEKRVTFEAWTLNGRGLILGRDDTGGVGMWDFVGTDGADVQEDMAYLRNKMETEPIHNWFELTYAQYLTIPRTVLQSMPAEWQRRFVRCLEELDKLIDWRPESPLQYWVSLRDTSTGKLVSITNDEHMDYERGRRRIPLKPSQLTAPEREAETSANNK